MANHQPPGIREWCFGTSSQGRGELLRRISRIYSAAREGSFAPELNEFLLDAVSATGLCLLEFRTNARPRMLFNAGIETNFDPHLTIYLEGAYLIDPWYNYSQNNERAAFFTSHGLADADFDWHEYERLYYRNLQTSDEAGYVFPLQSGQALHFAFFRRTEEPPFSARAISFLQDCLPFLNEAAQIYAESENFNAEDQQQLVEDHAAVIHALEAFGGDILTERERDIVKLLLRGYSAKAAARKLGISPGTVSIHRSNIYEKMGVDSQGGIFGKFMDTLLGVRNEMPLTDDGGQEPK